MSEPEIGWSSTQPVSTASWWESRRPRYNLGLLVAGPVAFICYVVAVEAVVPWEQYGDGPLWLPTLIMQGVAYLLMMVLANLCYFLGPLTEWLFRPEDPERYRRTVYKLGFWFSVALPFSVPLLVVISHL